MGLLNCYLSMRDVNGSKDWIKSRLLPFIAMGFSALVPIAHAAILFPYEQLQKQAGLNWYYLEGICMLTGVVFLAVSIHGKPPFFSQPNTVDYRADLHRPEFPSVGSPRPSTYSGLRTKSSTALSCSVL